MKITNAQNDCIIRIKIIDKIQCIKIYKNYNKQQLYK